MKPQFHARPSLRHALFACALAIVPAANASTLVAYDMGSGQNTTIWTDVSNSNLPLTPSAGTGTLTLDPNVAPAQSPYSASIGIYGGSDYTYTVTQTSAFDLQSVIFQVEITPGGPFPYGTGPLLSYNGGSQAIAANYFTSTGTEVIDPFPFTYYGGAWQWDLSGISDEITSISITLPNSAHSSTVGLRVDSAGTFVQAVPEPSMAGLAALGGGLLILRRRRNG